MVKLKATSFTLSTEVKYFEPFPGFGNGTHISVSYDVPEGLEGKELKVAMLEAKRSLDLLAWGMEKAKGGIPSELYAQRTSHLKKAYEAILGRSEGATLKESDDAGHAGGEEEGRG